MRAQRLPKHIMKNATPGGPERNQVMGSMAPVTEGAGPCDSDTQRSRVSLHAKQQNQKPKVPQAALPR